MGHHGAKYTQIDEGMCQGVICTCQNFFPFTNLVVRVTFLKVILDLLKNALIWSFLISLAVVSYFSAPLFLTSLPHHCYIAQHCLALHGGYWDNGLWGKMQELKYICFSAWITETSGKGAWPD